MAQEYTEISSDEEELIIAEDNTNTPIATNANKPIAEDNTNTPIATNANTINDAKIDSYTKNIIKSLEKITSEPEFFERKDNLAFWDTYVEFRGYKFEFTYFDIISSNASIKKKIHRIKKSFDKQVLSRIQKDLHSNIRYKKYRCRVEQLQTVDTNTQYLQPHISNYQSIFPNSNSNQDNSNLDLLAQTVLNQTNAPHYSHAMPAQPQPVPSVVQPVVPQFTNQNSNIYIEQLLEHTNKVDISKRALFQMENQETILQKKLQELRTQIISHSNYQHAVEMKFYENQKKILDKIQQEQIIQEQNATVMMNIIENLYLKLKNIETYIFLNEPSQNTHKDILTMIKSSIYYLTSYGTSVDES